MDDKKLFEMMKSVLDSLSDHPAAEGITDPVEEERIMDDKRLFEMMKSVLDSLSDEQKKKIRPCKNAEEIRSLVADVLSEVPDEALDAVAGGIKEAVPPDITPPYIPPSFHRPEKPLISDGDLLGSKKPPEDAEAPEDPRKTYF